VLFVDDEDFRIDQTGSEGGIAVAETIGELATAASEDAELETGDAVQPPIGVGEGLNERTFEGADGLKFFLVGTEMLAVGFEVIGGEEDRTACESGFEGVERDLGFAVGTTRTGGALRVGSIGSETGSERVGVGPVSGKSACPSLTLRVLFL
jgi:hypothetical protein